VAALDSIYDNLLNEAWSKTIAGNGKNTLLVHTEAEFKPEDTYYVFVCKPVTAALTKQKYTWQTSPSVIKFSTGDNEDNWKNLRIIEDKLIKGSDVISYIKNKETKLLSGLTQYILDIRYINRTVKDAIYASLNTNTKTGPGRFAAGYYFVSVNALGGGVPDLKTYFNIVKSLWDKGQTSDLDPMYVAAETLPYIEDLINVRNIHHKNAEITGIDTSGLLENINWDDPYPYGKIDSIVISTIKSYNPDFTDADVNDAYSAFYGWLQKQEDLPDDMGVQEWYDNAVENFRDADQYERRGMDEDEEAAAEEGYIDAAENLLIQQLNAFINGDSEEYKDFLKSRAIHKKGSEISGIDTSGLLEGGGLSFDAGGNDEYFNFVDYCKTLGWSDEEIVEFSEWFATKSDMAEDINDYGDPEAADAWWRVSSYFDAAIENAGYDAREHQDPTILLDHINDVKATIGRYYRQFKEYKKAQVIHKGASEIAGIDTIGLIETTTEICEQATLNPNGELRFGKYRIFQAGSGTQTAPYAQAINDTNLFSNRLATDVKSLEALGFKFDTVYYYQPPPRSDGKYVARAIAISGTDNNGEDIMWVRKGGFMAPSPAIYYKDRRAGDVKRMARLLSLQLKPANVVSVEDFLKAAVSPTAKIEKGGGWGYKRKKIKLRPDGKYDIFGEVSLRKDYSYALVGKPFFINTINDLPVKFGVIEGDLRVGLPVLNLDWFPEMVDGRLAFQEEAGMTPERFLEAGLLDRVTDDTEISFTTREVDKYGLNKIIRFKSKADWIDTIKAQDIHQKSSDITGIDTSGLLESKSRSNIGKWVSIMLKAAEEAAQDPKALVMAPNKARLVSADFWTSIPLSDGSIEGIRENFLNAIKQAQNFDIQNGNFSPVKNVIKKMKYDPKRLGSLSSGYQIYVGDLSSPKAQEEIKKDFIYKANRALFYRMEAVAEKEYPGNRWYTIIGPLVENGSIIKDFINGDLKEIKVFLKDYLASQDIHQKSTDIAGIDTSGLLEAANADGRVTEFVKALIEVDNFEDFKRIAKQLPDLSNTINGTPVGLLIKDAVSDNIGSLQGDGTQSLWFPTTPQDFFYKALYYYLRYHSSDSKSSRAFNKSLSYRQGPSLEEVEQAFNKWRDFKTSQNIHQKSTDITGIDTSGLLESWTDKDIEDYWNHYYNVGDPGPIGAIKNWPGLLFFNKWFVDMIDRENWNVDSIEDYFIEYSDRVADNLEQKDNEDRGYGELQEIACYRGYKKLYNYYRQFLADTDSQIYKDWKSSEAIHQKTTDITGIDTSGLLEQGESASKKPYVTEFNSIITKAKDARTFNDFEAAFEGTDPNIWNTDTTGKFFHKVFGVYFNSEPLLKINSKNDYERTKFGHLNEAINHYGEYLLLSRTDAEADRFSGEDARSEAAFVYRKQAENYFNYYLDIINAEEIHKKATDITGIDTSGLLEAYIWTGFSNEYLTDSFTKLIKKAATANTFEEFLAAHDDVDPKIWSTAKAESSYFKTFQHIFNVDLYKDKDGTRGNFIGVDTKLGALYRAIQRMGFYTVAAKTDHNPWHHNVGTKEYRIKSDLESAKKYFDTYKDIVDSENIHQKSSDITGIDTGGLLESNGDNIGKWVVIMVKAAELVAQDPKKITSNVKKANAIPADFWSPVTPSDGSVEGIGNSFINTIKQAQKFDLYNGDFTPVPGKFKVMKYDPNRPGSMPSGYQFYPGNLNSSKARTFIEYDLYDRAHRALVTAMYKVAKQEDPSLGTIPAEVLANVLRGFIRGDYKKTEEIYKDYLDAQNIHQKSSDITGIDTSGLLESNKAFNSEIYNTYSKALEANSFEEFKELIKQLPDPWKYEVMVGGAANSRAIIKDILGLKDFPTSYVPKTPADHFLTAVDHIQDVEHSTSVTLDDVRSGYAYAQEHFAKWLEYKKSQEIHQKTTDITGIDTSGLMEEANRVLFDKRFALMKWGRAIPGSNQFARHWALTSGFSEEDIENFGGQQWLIDGLIDWFVDMEGDKIKYQGGQVYKTGNLGQEEQIALYQKLEDDAVEAVKKDLEELYKDWMKSQEIYSKVTDITGIDTSGLLESNDNLTSDQDKTLFFRTVEGYKKYLPEISDTELIGFYNWFNNVKRVELGFGPYAGDNESFWDVFQQITMVAAEDEYGIPEHEIPDEFRSVAEMTMEKLYEEYKAHYIYKKSSEITGIDTSGLLEARDITSQEIHNRLLIRWKEGFIDEFKKVIKLPEEEGEKVYQWLLNKATETDCEEPRMYDTKAEEVYDRTAALYAEFVEEADTPGVKHANRHKAAMKLIYKVYLEELKAQQIHQTTTSITGIDTSGLLESEDDDASRERYWDHALEATATDWINSFKSYVGLERANKIYTWMLNKARVEHDSQATYNNLIDMYGKFARERKKKDGLSDWAPPENAKVMADIADAYDAEIIAQKTTDITGIDAAGLLEAKQYTGPLGPVKDKQGKEHDYQGWYNIIKPFITDLIKAVENNDFSNFVKLVDSRQKNMGGPGFNPYFNLVDKVYAKVLMELLDNEQAENAFDEAYSTVQSMIVYIDVHLKGQRDRDPDTLQRIPHAQIKQEYPRAVIAFNKFKDFLDAKNIHQKSTDITGIDTSGLLEAKPRSTPEEDNFWQNKINEYIDKLVNANTFEEFVGIIEKKPASFQFNPGMYYHDKIFVNAIDSQLGSHNKETGNPARSNFVAAFSAVQGFVSYVDLFYKKGETTPRLEKDRAAAKKKFDQWIEARQDWLRSQEIHQKSSDITGIDTSGLLE